MATHPESLVLTTGQRIDWLMGRLRVKSGALSRQLGISQTALWYYRTDAREIPGRTLAGLARSLGTSADFLLCLTDDPRPTGPHPTRAPSRSRKDIGGYLSPGPEQYEVVIPPPLDSPIRVLSAA